MNCPEFEEHLADYLADELPAAARRCAADHLAACAACRAEVAALEATLRTLERLDTVTPAEAAARTTSLRVVRRRSWPVRWAWSSTKAAALLALGVGLGRYMTTAAPALPPAGEHPAEHVEVVAREDGLHPQWVELGRKVARGHTTLASQLVTLAQAVQ